MKTNPILRYCCGFKVLGKTPSTATLSRFLTKLSTTTSLEQEFHNLVKKAIDIYLDDLIIGISNIKVNNQEIHRVITAVNNIIDFINSTNENLSEDFRDKLFDIGCDAENISVFTK